MKPTAGKKLSAAEAGTMHFAAYGPEDCIRRSAAGLPRASPGKGTGAAAAGQGRGLQGGLPRPGFPQDTPECGITHIFRCRKFMAKNLVLRLRPVIFAKTKQEFMIRNFNIQAWWWRSLTLVDNECGSVRV